MKTPNASDLSRQLFSWRSPATRIAFFYALVSGIWIIASDKAPHILVTNHETAEMVSVIKGWAFVAVTAMMLWGLVQRLLIQIAASEAELRESEEQTRAIFDGVNDAIFIHELETGAILDMNLTACRMFGHTKEEFQKLRIEDLGSGVEPCLQKNAMEAIARARAESEATFEWHGRKNNGRLFWTEVSVRVAVIGGQARLLVSVRDIAMRKEATERVRKLSRAVEQSPVSIIITNSAGRIEYVNPATCRLTGYTAAELNGENPRLLKTDHTPPEEYRKLWETIIGGGEWHGEFRNRKKNGDLYWDATSISPITDDEGKVTHFLAVKEDITERKRAEKELKESRLRLRALLGRLQKAREQERTRLSREVHDVLGQLLTGIKMDLSWLERRASRIGNEELRNTVAEKITGTTALTDMMLESVQKISRDLRPSLLDNLGLPSALQAEARQFSNRTGIACDLASMPATDDMSADCATTVFRIFQEILTNIVRHSGATRVRVALSRRPQGTRLEVEDNGCGISPEALQDPDSLGLLGMSERAELLGGHVEIHGTPAVGTRVTLTIPDDAA